jgi:hypothetical protein
VGQAFEVGRKVGGQAFGDDQKVRRGKLSKLTRKKVIWLLSMHFIKHDSITSGESSTMMIMNDSDENEWK